MVDEIHESDDQRATIGRTYAEGFASIGRSMSIAASTALHPMQARDAVFTVWKNGVHECFSSWHGIARNDALDELYALAESRDLTAHFGVDEIQKILAEEVAKAPPPVPPPSGLEKILDEVPDDGAQKINGKDQQPAEVPVIFPFPLDGKAIPRRPWAVPGLLLRRNITLLVAPPGSGKSLFTLQLGMVCASGTPEWGGWRPRGVFRVLVINSEEDEDEMKRRLYGAAKVMKFEQLPNLAFAAQPESIVIARADHRTKAVTRTPVMDAIVATIMTHHFDILIVDPFAETFVGDENDNSELKWAAVLWREVARRTNTAVLLVHHAKKYAQQMAGDMDAARGGGSLVGVARIVCTLFGMTVEEATRLNIDDEKRARYLRFDDAKANVTLVTKRARWFEKISVGLPNAGDDGEPADEVGILLPWRSPSAFDNMSELQANAILDKFNIGFVTDAGDRTGDPFAPNPEGRGSRITSRWGGYVIQAELQCSEQEARDILAAWVKERVVEIVQQPVKTGKKKGPNVPSPCLRVNESMRPGRVLDEAQL